MSDDKGRRFSDQMLERFEKKFDEKYQQLEKKIDGVDEKVTLINDDIRGAPGNCKKRGILGELSLGDERISSLEKWRNYMIALHTSLLFLVIGIIIKMAFF